MRTKTFEECQDIKDKPLWEEALSVRKFWCFVLMMQAELERHAAVETKRQRQIYDNAKSVGEKRGTDNVPHSFTTPHPLLLHKAPSIFHHEGCSLYSAISYSI